MPEHSPDATLFCDARVVLPDRVLDPGPLLAAGGRIVAFGPEAERRAPAHARRVALGGAYLAPGLIDAHVHGAGAHDVGDATPEALAAVGAALLKHGVTAYLPTTVACPPRALTAVLEVLTPALAAPPPGAVPLGAHLESNFLAPRFKGAQPEEALAAPDDPALLAVIERFRASIRVVTLAPELPGALALVRRLVGWGIRVSVGHTDATYAQVAAAVEAGATRVTHLCNAQRGFHHREPGVLGAGLALDALACELIADGVHVHPAGLKIAYRCKGPDKLMLVSDALRGTGLPPGRYKLGPQETIVDEQVARLPDGTIAGSILTLDRAVGRMVAEAGASVPEAFAMASAAPAADLGLADRGRIQPGYRADLAAFAPDDFRCVGAWVAEEPT